MNQNGKSPIRVGVAGLGRSGWNIHIRTFTNMQDKFQVVAVHDIDEARIDTHAPLGHQMTMKTRRSFPSVGFSPFVFIFYLLFFLFLGGYKGASPIIVHPHPNPLPSRARGKYTRGFPFSYLDS